MLFFFNTSTEYVVREVEQNLMQAEKKNLTINVLLNSLDYCYLTNWIADKNTKTNTESESRVSLCKIVDPDPRIDLFNTINAGAIR